MEEDAERVDTGSVTKNLLQEYQGKSLRLLTNLWLDFGVSSSKLGFHPFKLKA